MAQGGDGQVKDRNGDREWAGLGSKCKKTKYQTFQNKNQVTRNTRERRYHSEGHRGRYREIKVKIKWK